MTQNGHIIIIGVVLETTDGFYYRFSNPENNSRQDGLIHFENGILSYPDLRIKTFQVYSLLPNDTDYKMKEFGAKKSNTANLAYAIVHGPDAADYLDPSTFGTTATQESIDSTPSVNFGDVNVVLVSETFQPRNLLGSNALTVGNSSDDGLVVFGSNALPVSQGQFGQYPLFAFTRRGISALKPGATVKFESVVPFALNEEIVGKNAILSTGGALFYLTKRGLKIFSAGKTENLSESLLNAKDSSRFSAILNEDVSLGYFLEKSTGREEVWIGGDLGTFVFSLTYQRWFFLSNIRKEFLRIYDKVIGLDGEGVLWEENAGDDEAGYVQTSPIHFGAPEILKRFRRIFYRKGDTVIGNNTVPLVSCVQSNTARSITITDDNVAEFNEISIDYEQRYPWKVGENA
jgi:hypothetical protein